MQAHERIRKPRGSEVPPPCVFSALRPPHVQTGVASAPQRRSSGPRRPPPRSSAHTVGRIAAIARGGINQASCAAKSRRTSAMRCRALLILPRLGVNVAAGCRLVANTTASRCERQAGSKHPCKFRTGGWRSPFKKGSRSVRVFSAPSARATTRKRLTHSSLSWMGTEPLR